LVGSLNLFSLSIIKWDFNPLSSWKLLFNVAQFKRRVENFLTQTHSHKKYSFNSFSFDLILLYLLIYTFNFYFWLPLLLKYTMKHLAWFFFYNLNDFFLILLIHKNISFISWIIFSLIFIYLFILFFKFNTFTVTKMKKRSSFHECCSANES